MNVFLAELFTLFFGTFGWILEVSRIIWDAIRPSSLEMNVKGKKVLIVGAGDIGVQLGREFATRGAHLSFWDSNKKVLETLPEKFASLSDVKPLTQVVDIRNFDEVSNAVSRLLDELNFEVDILVNSAGVVNNVDYLEESIERTHLIIDVNVKGVINTIRAFIPRFLKRRHGHIVTLSSMSGQIGCPHICEYSASKFAVLGYMEAVEVDCIAQGVNDLDFTTICPSFIMTTMAGNASFTGSLNWRISTLEDACREMIQAILTKKVVTIIPWDARLICSFKYLLSEKRMRHLISRQHPY